MKKLRTSLDKTMYKEIWIYRKQDLQISFKNVWTIFKIKRINFIQLYTKVYTKKHLMLNLKNIKYILMKIYISVGVTSEKWMFTETDLSQYLNVAYNLA